MHARRRYQNYRRLLIHILWPPCPSLSFYAYHRTIFLCLLRALPCRLLEGLLFLGATRYPGNCNPKSVFGSQSLLTMPRISYNAPMPASSPCLYHRRRRLNSPFLILNNAYRALDITQPNTPHRGRRPQLPRPQRRRRKRLHEQLPRRTRHSINSKQTSCCGGDRVLGGREGRRGYAAAGCDLSVFELVLVEGFRLRGEGGGGEIGEVGDVG